MEKRYIVRRLTPKECCRLQGYPDEWLDIGDWTDSKGKKHKEADGPKYKALGNSIAVPAWGYIIKGIIEQLKSDGVDEQKMGSLFDGIGGFPRLWKHFGGDPVWASEIEEFCIAVTKIRFPEEERPSHMECNGDSCEIVFDTPKDDGSDRDYVESIGELRI